MGNFTSKKESESWNELEYMTHSGAPIFRSHEETVELYRLYRISGGYQINVYPFTHTISIMRNHNYISIDEYLRDQKIDIPYVGYEDIPENFTCYSIPPGLRMAREDLESIKTMKYLLELHREKCRLLQKYLNKNIMGIILTY
jgi:hypothetical protein